MTIDQKFDALKKAIAQYQCVIIAYSGGVDSVFLLKTAYDTLGKANVLACIGVSDSLAQSEYDGAIDVARKIGAEVELVHPDEMNNPDYLANPTNRCYFCKTELYQLLNLLAEKKHYDAVLCGTNADDVGDYRPGLKAANEKRIISPLQQVELTKADIRTLSQKMGLPTWNKPAQPCLSSRVMYGQEITPERLKQVEEAEAFLRQLGLIELRVRHHGDLARIEVLPSEIELLTHQTQRDEIVNFFKKLGFTYISLDLQGFRSGSGNELLQLKK
jgi:uncharacterized protein